jgi:hypothetical protein
MTKVADLCPPGIVTLGGTLATVGFALTNGTLKPEVQAGYEMDTVAVTGCPPLTGDANVKPLTGGGVTVNNVVRVVTPDDAVSVTGVLLHCDVVVTGTCRYLLPAGTVTLLGTKATDGLLEESLTCQPPAGANAPR